MVEATNNLLLNRVFTRNTFKALINESRDTSYNAAVVRYVADPEGKSHQQIISFIYKLMDNEYRNEYYYKNTLLNKLLLGIHSPKTTVALTEVPVNKSKADFILINGKAVVYEIKTELDNLDRLENQLNDYFKAFNNVCVVTSEATFEAVNKKLVNSNVGIYVLTHRNTISLRKEAVNDASRLDLGIIFKILRKKEYESIIKEVYGYLPDVSQFKYYSECKKLFENIDVWTAYTMFIKELKKRNSIDMELFEKVPKEIKSIIYFSDFNIKDYVNLNRFLQSKYRG